MTLEDLKKEIESKSDRYAQFAYRDENNKTTGQGVYSEEGIELEELYPILEKYFTTNDYWIQRIKDFLKINDPKRVLEILENLGMEGKEGEI